jgi:transposase
MPKSTFVEMPKEEQSQMLAALRRARYGYLLALHILLLCAAGRTPTAIADVLFCSRSSVYRAVRAYRAGTLGLDRDDQGQFVSSVRTTVRVPTLRRWLLALLEAPPRAYGWGRTRWSCATLALTLQAKRGITVSAETLRRWVHEVGWVWKRAKLGAKDDDPHRVARLALVTILQFREQLSDRQAAGAPRYESLEEFIQQFGAPRSALPGQGLFSFADPVFPELSLLVLTQPQDCCVRCGLPLDDCSCPF